MTFVSLLLARLRSTRAVLRLGHRWAESGKLSPARTAFHQVLESRPDPDLACEAALQLWVVYAQLGDVRRSHQMYQEALRFQAADKEESLGQAAISIGTTLGAHYTFGSVPVPRVTERIYPLTIASADKAVSAAAAIGFGIMQWELANDLDDMNRYRQVAKSFQTAFDTRHPDYAPTAAHWLAFFYDQIGTPERGRSALEWLIDSGDPQYADRAAESLEHLEQD
jgi:tetratricopeptide (TPR) repeat protein